ncbi:MAG: hypothetical protein JXN62_12725 [Bacteroidales bacterium]|nr:hypothetical protein [Bacteroidales bacterium]
MKELDIRDILHILKKRIWLITAITVLALVLGIVYTFFIVTPVYSAFTTIYVGRNTSDSGTSDALVYQDLMLGEELVNDYRELAKSRQVAELTNEKIYGSTLTTEDISEMIDVQSRTNTRVIEITAEHEQADVAVSVANTVAEVFKERATAIMNIENIQIIDTAIDPIKPTKPNKTVNTALSLLIGLAIGVGIAFLIEFMDNKIRTPEDVEEILGLTVLGIILNFDNSKLDKKVEKKAGGAVR